MTPVSLRLSRRILAFYYSSLREYKPAVFFLILTLFSLFKHPDFVMKINDKKSRQFDLSDVIFKWE